MLCATAKPLNFNLKRMQPAVATKLISRARFSPLGPGRASTRCVCQYAELRLVAELGLSAYNLSCHICAPVQSAIGPWFNFDASWYCATRAITMGATDEGELEGGRESLIALVKSAPAEIAECMAGRRSVESLASNASSMSAFSTTSTRSVRWRSNIRALHLYCALLRLGQRTSHLLQGDGHLCGHSHTATVPAPVQGNMVP